MEFNTEEDRLNLIQTMNNFDSIDGEFFQTLYFYFKELELNEDRDLYKSIKIPSVEDIEKIKSDLKNIFKSYIEKYY